MKKTVLNTRMVFGAFTKKISHRTPNPDVKLIGMPKSDEQRLTSYVDNGSEADFRTMVERYAGMVMASALRRTGDQELTEDVTQRVFIILARKAKSLQHHPAIRAWLHTTTRLECHSVLRSERRQQRKRQALMNESSPLTESHLPEYFFDERRPFLEEALDSLNESDRRLILLRFVDEISYVELSHRLGKSEVACRKRVSTVLEKLNQLLQKKGVEMPAAAVGAVLSGQLGKTPAEEISASIATKVLADLNTASTSTLLINTIETMAYRKTKAFVAAMLLAAIPIGVQWSRNTKLQREIASSNASAEQASANLSRVSQESSVSPSPEPQESSASPSPEPPEPVPTKS
ncbi:MAG: RNA polymerase sigma factor (sigma-70 family) [Verrucomicrobiales bacterium]|jgi:RNA polymerase sigma factor (sigma-70 family)